MRVLVIAAALGAVGALIAGSRAAAQVPKPAVPAAPAAPAQRRFWVPRFSGDALSSGELYQANGIDSRRPGQTWRVSLNQQATFFGEFNIGWSLLLSSEGSDARQSISQFGLNPRYKWATFHIGNFSQNYTEYTVQGTRLKGGGIDLRPGAFRLSVQGGESQRTIFGGPANLAYRRHLYAASIGVGREQSSSIDFTVARAKDDAKSLAPALADTLLLDTIPAALRPRIETRPQDNLVAGARGRLRLFGNRVALKGELSGALITRDAESPEATAESVSGGSTLGGLMPLRLSTSGDYAYRVDAETQLDRASLNGGYEYIGAGYTSLGVASLINDRRAYNVGGTLRLLAGHMSLQSQYQHQNDNLLSQKLATTNRDALSGTIVGVLGRRLTTSVTAVFNTTTNDAVVDTFRINNRAFAFMSNSSLQVSLFGRGRPTPINVSYALQRTTDDNAIVQVPDVTVQNVSTAIQIPVNRVVSVSPTASLAITQMPTAPSQRNTYVGFRGQARGKQAMASLSATQTFTNSRGVFSVNSQLSYTLPLQGRVTVQLRHARYDAIGTRPRFQETFGTMSLARNF